MSCPFFSWVFQSVHLALRKKGNGGRKEGKDEGMGRASVPEPHVCARGYAGCRVLMPVVGLGLEMSVREYEGIFCGSVYF